MQKYLLSPHVHLCFTDDHAVLLDLRRDRYIGLGPQQTVALAHRIEGWPDTRACAPPAARTNNDEALRRLLSNGMLTTDAAIGKPAQPPTLPRSESTVTEDELEARPSPTARQILRYLRAALTARLALKWRPIATVVARAQGRKQRRAHLRSTDPEQLRQLTAAFLYLRPLLFGARDECLYDSLALVEFMALHEVYPDWVFGVQTRPFLAHSWVQDGAAVCNDTPEYVRRFTPILVV